MRARAAEIHWLQGIRSAGLLDDALVVLVSSCRSDDSSAARDATAIDRLVGPGYQVVFFRVVPSLPTGRGGVIFSARGAHGRFFRFRCSDPPPAMPTQRGPGGHKQSQQRKRLDASTRANFNKHLPSWYCRLDPSISARACVSPEAMVLGGLDGVAKAAGSTAGHSGANACPHIQRSATSTKCTGRGRHTPLCEGFGPAAACGESFGVGQKSGHTFHR